ncbi:hypothetical protein PsYK624_137150 [Phanerochaete sordida]|uniref:Uncharacterized protein n=1 Tax=Phanerochaete sordida TaxID=48140 RepID=A0A9P3LK99_9APHY|nr:hypothetical protein PsYK624_137150 [Phanerochaete sordida]
MTLRRFSSRLLLGQHSDVLEHQPRTSPGDVSYHDGPSACRAQTEPRPPICPVCGRLRFASLREHSDLVQPSHTSSRRSSHSLADWAKGGCLQLHQSTKVRPDLDVAGTRKLRILALTHDLSKGYRLAALIQLSTRLTLKTGCRPDGASSVDCSPLWRRRPSMIPPTQTISADRARRTRRAGDEVRCVPVLARTSTHARRTSRYVGSCETDAEDNEYPWIIEIICARANAAHSPRSRCRPRRSASRKRGRALAFSYLRRSWLRLTCRNDLGLFARWVRTARSGERRADVQDAAQGPLGDLEHVRQPHAGFL